jgi:1-phosphatidylinositol phosphodiesterase
MEWLAHGVSGSGLLLEAKEGQSKAAPAVAAHRGRLWCLWEDFDGHLWYAATTGEGQFGQRETFPSPGRPVITNLNGHLHVLVASEGGQVTHFLFDEDEKQEWQNLGPLDADAGVIATSTPALAAFHNGLFLVYLSDTKLYYVVWSLYSQQWAAPKPLAPERTFSGVPALFVLDGVLHVLCQTDSAKRDILAYRYEYDDGVWTNVDDVSEGKAVSGVSATSYGDNVYFGYIEDGPDNKTHAVYIASHTNGQLQPQEAVADQTAATPPQIAILNGRIHAIFNDNTEHKELRWYSRPILGYSMSSWMAKVADETALTGMTVPGTHDTCARSNIPFVRTQYLSVTQQLALGIRFLDLRLRRHDDGKLFCYHGGIPIDYPAGLSFASVMDEVWKFMKSSDSHQPTETLLISINNDDTSQAQKDKPEIFYNAVAEAIGDTPPYTDGKPRWYTEPVLPTLGEVRGKAVLLRRFRGDPAVSPTSRLGLDLSEWLDDNPFFTIVTPNNVNVHLQDKWKYADRIDLKDLITSKHGFVRAMMERAAPLAAGLSLAGLSLTDVPGVAAQAVKGIQDQGDNSDHLYINFCSCVGGE